MSTNSTPDGDLFWTHMNVGFFQCHFSVCEADSELHVWPKAHFLKEAFLGNARCSAFGVQARGVTEIEITFNLVYPARQM